MRDSTGSRRDETAQAKALDRQGVGSSLHQRSRCAVDQPNTVGDHRCAPRCLLFLDDYPGVQAMTTRSEELRTIGQVREFLRELLDPKTTPKVPATIRDKARRLLRHYPLTLSIITKEAHL
jgi:hypothetical protein